MAKQTWLQWLRACARDPKSPTKLAPGSLGALTGQDHRALSAISACWDLYASSDADGEQGALAAIRSLLPALQPSCHFFARELIAFSLDWSDREKLWAIVTRPGRMPEAPDCDFCGARIRASDDSARCGSCSEHCAAHMDSVHGKEAEELRKGLERLIMAAHEDDGVPAREIQRLLDDVDARDSLAFLESKEIRAKLTPPTGL